VLVRGRCTASCSSLQIPYMCAACRLVVRPAWPVALSAPCWGSCRAPAGRCCCLLLPACASWLWHQALLRCWQVRVRYMCGVRAAVLAGSGVFHVLATAPAQLCAVGEDAQVLAVKGRVHLHNIKHGEDTCCSVACTRPTCASWRLLQRALQERHTFVNSAPNATST
jgi:hypothetical protein